MRMFNTQFKCSITEILHLLGHIKNLSSLFYYSQFFLKEELFYFAKKNSLSLNSLTSLTSKKIYVISKVFFILSSLNYTFVLPCPITYHGL